MTPSSELAQHLNKNGISTNRALSILLEEPQDNITTSSAPSLGLTLQVSSLLSSDSSQQSSLISSASNIDLPSNSKKQPDVISLLLNAKITDTIDEDIDDDNGNITDHSSCNKQNSSLSRNAPFGAQPANYSDVKTYNTGVKDQLGKRSNIKKARIGNISDSDFESTKKSLISDKRIAQRGTSADQIFNNPTLTYLIAHGAIYCAEDLALFSKINKATDKMFRSENLINYLSKMKCYNTYLDIIIQKKLMHLVNKYLEEQKITDQNPITNVVQQYATKYNNFPIIKNLFARNIDYNLFNSYLNLAINKDFEYLVLFIMENQRDLSSFNSITFASLANTNNPALFKKILNIIKNRLSKEDFQNRLISSLILHNCIKNNNLEYLKICMDEYDSYIIKNEIEQTILHLACQFNYQPIIDFLLSKLPEDQFNEMLELDIYDQTPLSYAIKNDNIELVNILLAKYGKTSTVKIGKALALALNNKNYKLFETILNTVSKELINETINICFNTISKVFLTSDKNGGQIFLDLETIKYFNEKYKPEINTLDSVKNFITNYSSNLPLIQYLIDNGALITDDLLLQVSKKADFEIIDLILENLDYDFNTSDSEGNTILHKMARNVNLCKNITKLDLLIADFVKKGLAVTKKNNKGETALHSIFEDISEISISKSCSLAGNLLKYGVDINAQNDDGNSALHYAALLGGRSEKAISSLVKLGADVNLENKKKQTPLNYGIITSTINEISSDVIIPLVENGADINTRDSDNNTPLHNYLSNYKPDNLDEYTETIQKLLSIYPDIDITLKNNSGNTPLHLLIMNFEKCFELDEDTNLSIINLFEKSFAIKNNFGQTPYDLALSLADVEERQSLRDMLLEISKYIKPKE